MLIDSKTFGISEKRGLFEWLKNGGMIYLDKYAIHLKMGFPFFDVRLYYHGQQTDTKVLLNNGEPVDNSKKKEPEEFESKVDDGDLFG